MLLNTRYTILKSKIIIVLVKNSIKKTTISIVLIKS